MTQSPRPLSVIRATPLAERAAAIAGQDDGPARELSPRATQALLRWREQTPFREPQRFAARLVSDGLSEAAFLRLLALEDADVVPRSWLRWFEGVEGTTRPHRQEAPEAALVDRFVAHAAVQLESTWTATLNRAAAQGLEVDVAAVVRAMAGALMQRLCRLVRPTLALEQQVAELRGELDRLDPQRRACFAERMADPAVASSLWREYPVLARQVAVMTDHWSAVCAELVEHLVTDWPELRRGLVGPREVGPLVRVALGRGDTHRGGRSVAILTFAGGLRLVYKPRSLAIDVRFGELLDWLARRGAPRLHTPRTLARVGHGWAEHVDHAPCESPAEIERFFERQGAQLALLFVLEATDCHADNVIACGEHPTLIDLETLLQPRVRAARGAEDTSVLRVGLVSTTMHDVDGVDFSGLGAPDPRQPARHLPWLGDTPSRPAEHADALVRGFEAMAATLSREREALLAPTGPLAGFAEDEIRVVLRATDAYGLLLRETTHPDLMRDAVDRDRALDRLWLETVDRPDLARVIRHEREDLWSEDVPYFTTTPGARDLVSSRGERIDGFLTQSSMTSVEQRLRELDRELPRQVQILREALAAMETRPAHPPDRTTPAATPQATPASTPATTDQLLATATELAERLRVRAIADGRRVAWLDVRGSRGGPAVVPCGVDLYAGTAGIALFFAMLSRVTGDERHRELADRVTSGVLDAIHDGSGARTIGGYDGAGGTLFVLAHLAAVRPEPRYRSAAARLIDQIEGGIANDGLLDLISGSAGAIGGLLAWARVDTGERPLAAARRCGEHLLERSVALGDGLAWTCGSGRPPLVGYAHGAAGIGDMLGALGEALGERRFCEAASAAFAYERALFDDRAGGWPDLEAHGERRCRASWCRGAVGCGLARVRALGRGADPCVDPCAADELARACAFTRATATLDDSLCHGTLGALELLQLEAEWRDDDALRRDVALRSSALLDAIDRRGPWCGNRRHTETPGLLTGVAGIGYGLVRLAAPATAPSVLTLAPPARS